MSKNKEDSTMGLPKVSGKKRWSVEEDDDPELGQPSKKVVCTSPPYALCAEDVISSSPICPQLSRSATAAAAPTTTHLAGMSTEVVEYDVTDLHHSTQKGGDDDDLEGDTLEEDFIDDEEDKDSGFIDGNSIDNSDEEEDYCAVDGKSEPPPSSFPSQNFVSSNIEKPHFSNDSNSVEAPSSMTTIPSHSGIPSCVNVSSPSKSSVSFSTPSTTASDLSSISTVASTLVRKNSTNVMFSQSGVSSSYNPQRYQPPISSPMPVTYSSDVYESRPCIPSWSCTFYDGSHPTTTNKYMEISPSRSNQSASQSIQCDENGKSYLELGGGGTTVSYPRAYSNECSSFTTAPSSFTSSYCQSFAAGTTTPSSYNGAVNGYHNNSRLTNISESPPPTTPQFSYHRVDSYSSNGYDADGGCSYVYQTNNSVPVPPSRGPSFAPHRTSQRCTSSVCDLTRISPRPACYNQQRLMVLNISMFKLNRFSRYPEPSLLRSVLICNTLRHIEKEMESEGLNMAAILSHSHSYSLHAGNNVSSYGPACLDTMPSASTGNLFSDNPPLPSLHSPLAPHHHPPLPPPTPPMTPPPPSSFPFTPCVSPLYPPYSSSSAVSASVSKEPSINLDSNGSFKEDDSYLLRPLLPQSPSLNGDRTPDCDSERPSEDRVEEITASSTPLGNSFPQREGGVVVGSRNEDRIGVINWCSVLSLSSQTDLDAINNNEWGSGDRDHHSSLSSPLSSSSMQHHQQTFPNESSSSNSPSLFNNNTNSRDILMLNSSNSSSTTDHQESCGGDSGCWRLPSLSADDVLKSFPPAEHHHHRLIRQEDELDFNVLVGS